MNKLRIEVMASALLVLPMPAFADTGHAVIKGTTAHPEIEGEVTLTDTASGLLVQGSLKGANPGLHGFHIHEFGSCDDNGNAAGGHYNPQGTPHGNLVTDGPTAAHAGDLGNIKVAEDGSAAWLYTLTNLKLSAGPNAVAGRAFIVHEKLDDFGQPTGNAGGRIACGTIVIIKPQAPAAN